MLASFYWVLEASFAKLLFQVQLSKCEGKARQVSFSPPERTPFYLTQVHL